ncbi:pilus (MSHA type) biogenesis protein MshL [Noviherbaspirillum sp. ST9]|uniref:pilus (MSHA type) biogenesis protein MshL n=1 Tax=Noviherbaspirillum sp. ST9 TaxID=3401606 RepID=UPI003B586AC5
MTTQRQTVEKTILALAVASLVACAPQIPKRETYNLIDAELTKAAQQGTGTRPGDAVSEALLPPLKVEIPTPSAPAEERFNVTFNNVPAKHFFLSLATGTRYSMLVHPDVSGTISANLKDVTLFEALEVIRELYGYEYRVEGATIIIKPLTMQTRVFHVNYLSANRRGTSDTRVTSGSISDSSNNQQSAGNTGSTNSGATETQTTFNSSRITTSSVSDFWVELKASIEAIMGGREGRSVVISPQSGVVVVRGMWDELRNIEAYLRATQASVDRQVILDAKILEVELNDSFQSGINWAAFRAGSHTSIGSAGLLTQGATLSPPTASGAPVALTSTAQPGLIAIPGSTISAPSPTGGTAAGTTPASLFGIAFQSTNFAALLSFLETQGTVHVLSSPRIATMNNQKAVLKVGKDEFFVTRISTNTSATGATTTTSPTVTVQPFFSGVALDVTPQIDEQGNIMLHVHPSVSNVSTIDKPLNLGTLGTFNLPLASSAISETDSIVRGRDGQIVAIGGLMRQASISDRSGLPGAGDAPGLGALFRNTKESLQKRELVILLKPTIVQGNNWSRDIIDAQGRIQGMAPRNGNGQ